VFPPEALVVPPSLVVEVRVLGDEAQKIALANHQAMIEQFAPGIAEQGARRSSCSGRTAVRTTLVLTASDRQANRAPFLVSRSSPSTSGWMFPLCFAPADARASNARTRFSSHQLSRRLTISPQPPNWPIEDHDDRTWVITEAPGVKTTQRSL